MKQFILLLFLILFISCNHKIEIENKTIIDRIEYVYDLKMYIDKHIWNGFYDTGFDVPLIYYADDACYISNPTEQFINQYKPDLVFENNKIKVYKTSPIDSIPFHMAVSVSFDNKEDYDYRSPFMKCSSVETTNKIVPDVPSTEVWATMILHEYFHGFQFKHSEFLDYFEQNVAFMSQDTLKHIYSHNEWFRESVDKENGLLLSALASIDSTEIAVLINSFFQFRDQRRKDTQKILNLDIKCIEGIFERMEGTARYVEYSLYDKFTSKPADANLMKSDTLYHSYSYFRDFNFEEAQWLYKTGKTYFYATGFNIARLLDKLGIEYKSKLFTDGRFSLEEILKAEYR